MFEIVFIPTEYEMDNTLFEKEVLNLIEEFSGLKKTVELSFDAVNNSIDELSLLIQQSCHNIGKTNNEVNVLKNKLVELDRDRIELKNTQKELSEQIDKLEKKLKVFIKKIDWKKLGKWIIILATIIGFFAELINKFDGIKNLISKIFK